MTVFEKSDRIGGNLRAYANNDLARPDDLLVGGPHYEVMAKKLGIEMRFNTEANAKFMRSVLHQYDVCLIAAGARTDTQAATRTSKAPSECCRCAGRGAWPRASRPSAW